MWAMQLQKRIEVLRSQIKGREKMSEEALIRNYTPRDFLSIRKIHEKNNIDYCLPDLSRFLINKVLEVDGEVRASYGMQSAAECYLWLDKGNWTGAEERWLAIKALDREATEEVRKLGIENVLCCIPPGYERFGRRIKELGYKPLRDGWTIYCKAGDRK
jgi:hypothetical protein